MNSGNGGEEPRYWNRPRDEQGLPPTGPANRRPASQSPGENPPTPSPPASPQPNQNRRQLPLIASVAGVAALVGGVIGGLAVALLVDDEGDRTDEAATGSRSVSVEISSAISDVAQQARPGVVRVESATRVASDDRDIGSGVIIDNLEGYILTNAHVVLGTEALQVVLADGTVRPAVLIGHDYPYTDVAVLQISPGNLTAIEPGDSSALRLGETVIAIGNPLAEFDGSVTVGVVSGLNRSRTYEGIRQSDLIQTDAAVNNGNSGGALLNLDGQLVGLPMSVLREVGSGASVEGIAFALPSDRAMAIAERIIAEGGSIERPGMDLQVVDLSPENATNFQNVAVNEGALVVAIRPRGSGALAGIQLGDVIVEVGGEAVNRERALHQVLERYDAGDTVQVVFNRNGRIIEAEVTLAKRS